MANIESRLKSFLRNELETVPFATLFTLRQVQPEGGTDLVHKFPIGRFTSAKEMADELVPLIMERAKDTAQASFGGPSKFCVFSLTKKDAEGVTTKKEAFRARYDFLLRGEARMSGMVGDSEPATQAGITAQLMRHQEATMRMSIEGFSSVMEHMSETVRSLTERLTAAEESQMEYRRRVNEYAADEHDREMTKLEKLNKIESMNELKREMYKHLGPVVARELPQVLKHFGLAGGEKKLPAETPPTSQESHVPPDEPVEAKSEVVEEKKGGIDSALKEILFSLPEEKQMDLLASLPPEKRELLMGLIGA
jgi:hypothetical protein